MGDYFHSTANSGPLLLAVVFSALAGLVSILSPCVLPLVPGYLSFVTGLAGNDLDAGNLDSGKLDSGKLDTGKDAEAETTGGGVAVKTRSATRVRGRILAGTSLFVLGIAIVYTLLAVTVVGIGFTLRTHERALDIVLGVLVIVLGLGYLGWIPGLQREARISKLPAAGLIGAPIFGGIFALSWVPCTGPTLSAVLSLAATSGETGRAVVLVLAYCLGLGVPFVLFGLFFRKLLGVFRAVRRNSRWVTRVGGVLLILVGIGLVTGGWDHFLIWLKTSLDFSGGSLL
jgi:cytochrome c-type biogenesis protein